MIPDHIFLSVYLKSIFIVSLAVLSGLPKILYALPPTHPPQCSSILECVFKIIDAAKI
jgi:hypothetical protein